MDIFNENLILTLTNTHLVYYCILIYILSWILLFKYKNPLQAYVRYITFFVIDILDSIYVSIKNFFIQTANSEIEPDYRTGL